MRLVAVAVLTATLGAASAAFASPDRATAYWGWRYGPISGSATLTATSPVLTCPGNLRNERRLIQGAYRLSFTGTSMRRTRAAADINYSIAAGGPAGNTEPIRTRVRGSSVETVQIRTITYDNFDNPICTLEGRRCTSGGTREFRKVANRLNVWPRPRARVHIYPPRAIDFSTCAPDVGHPNSVWPVAAFGKLFPYAWFNRARAVFKFAWSGRVKGETETGVPITGTLTYRSSIGIVRMPGTPRARCRAC
jgi:hypothetical protein